MPEQRSADELTVTTHRSGDVTVLDVGGRLSLPAVPKLMQAICAAIAGSPGRDAVCDVSGLAEPSSMPSTLMAFPAALRQCGGWPANTLHIAGASPALTRMLVAQRIPRYVPTFATVAAAVASAQVEAAAQRGTLALPPSTTSPRTARLALADQWPHGRPGRDDAALVLHELTLNAVVHVDRLCWASWAISDDQVVVAVADSDSTEPVLGPLSQTGPSGRGLRLVDGLSTRWGVRLRYPVGKVIWAELPVVGAA